jgi:cell division septal protein FtsQ
MTEIEIRKRQLTEEHTTQTGQKSIRKPQAEQLQAGPSHTSQPQAKQPQTRPPHASQLQNERSLLSVSDTYSVDILHSTTRRETSMPGTAASKSIANKLAAEPARVGSDRPPEGLTPFPRVAPASVKLTESADRLSAAIVRTKKAQKSSSLRILAAFALFCVLAAAAAVVLPRLTKIESIRISGLETLTENAILSAIGSIGDKSLLTLNLKEVKARIEQNPRVAQARVFRMLPSALGVDIRERSAVAVIMLSSEQGSKLALIDGEGTAFALVDADDSKSPDLPVISGIQFEQFQPGQRLPDMLRPLFADLQKIRNESPELLVAFSEIRIVRNSEYSAELLMYPVHMKTAVRMPLRLSADALRNSLVVLDILRSRGYGNQPSEIDFQSGTVVYQTKEAVSG